MKKLYEAPKAEEILFATEDVLNASFTGNPGAGEQEGGGNSTEIGDKINLW